MRAGWIRTVAAVSLAAIGLPAGVLLSGYRDAQGKPRGPTTQQSPTRIAYFNSTEVLRQFHKANQRTKEIINKQQAYGNELQRLRANLEEGNQMLARAKGDEKESLDSQVTDLRRKIEDLEMIAKHDMADRQEAAALDLYKSIAKVAEELATERGLDVIEFFPGNAAGDRVTPAIAQHQMQTPARTPIHLDKKYDLTAEVIERLNKLD